MYCIKTYNLNGTDLHCKTFYKCKKDVMESLGNLTEEYLNKYIIIVTDIWFDESGDLQECQIWPFMPKDYLVQQNLLLLGDKK